MLEQKMTKILTMTGPCDLTFFIPHLVPKLEHTTLSKILSSHLIALRNSPSTPQQLFLPLCSHLY